MQRGRGPLPQSEPFLRQTNLTSVSTITNDTASAVPFTGTQDIPDDELTTNKSLFFEYMYNHVIALTDSGGGATEVDVPPLRAEGERR